MWADAGRGLPAERKDIRTRDMLPFQLASYCHHRRALLAFAALGLNMSHCLPCGGFAAKQHKCVPGFDTLLQGGNQQMQRKLNGQMNVEIIGATISDLMNMLLKLQLCLENKTKAPMNVTLI